MLTPDRLAGLPASTARRLSAPTADPLGEVDPEHEADEQPDDRDHEEADDRARGRPTTSVLVGTPAALQPAAGHGVLHDRADHEERGDHGEDRPRRSSPPSDGPDQHGAERRAGRAGEDRDHDAEEADDHDQAARASTVPVMPEPGTRASHVAGRRRRPRTIAVRGLCRCRLSAVSGRRSVLVSGRRRACRPACRSRR